MKETKFKILVIGIAVSLTVAIHYGWVFEPIFGDSHWIHAIHGRFCYIPIVMGATLFGIRGGLITASLITIAVLPFIFLSPLSEHNFSGEMVEIVFYFAIALLTGAITEQVMIQQKKNEQTQIQLERAHRLSLLGQMAATMAHEIKNPLASIKGSVEILSDGETSPADKKEFENIAYNEIKRVDKTIKEFLNFARPKKTEFKNMNLSESTQHAVKQISTQAEKINIRIESDISPDILIEADQEKIHQVLLNLLINALEASQSGSIIKVSLTTASADNVLLTVTDNGTGIPSEDINKIFDPFYSTKSSGSGLGLAVVKSIIDDHNGQIEVKTAPGQGTAFIITLKQKVLTDD